MENQTKDGWGTRGFDIQGSHSRGQEAIARWEVPRCVRRVRLAGMVWAEGVPEQTRAQKSESPAEVTSKAGYAGTLVWSCCGVKGVMVRAEAEAIPVIMVQQTEKLNRKQQGRRKGSPMTPHPSANVQSWCRPQHGRPHDSCTIGVLDRVAEEKGRAKLTTLPVKHPALPHPCCGPWLDIVDAVQHGSPGL